MLTYCTQAYTRNTSCRDSEVLENANNYASQLCPKSHIILLIVDVTRESSDVKKVMQVTSLVKQQQNRGVLIPSTPEPDNTSPYRQREPTSKMRHYWWVNFTPAQRTRKNIPAYGPNPTYGPIKSCLGQCLRHWHHPGFILALLKRRISFWCSPKHYAYKTFCLGLMIIFWNSLRQHKSRWKCLIFVGL